MACYWYEKQDQVKALSELSSVFRWKYMTFDFLRCISLCSEMDDILYRGIIDGLHSHACKKKLPPNTREVTQHLGVCPEFTVDLENLMESSEVNYDYNGYTYKCETTLQNRQLTFAIKKNWPERGECTFPLGNLTVIENGNSIIYPLKHIVLIDQESFPLHITHVIQDVFERLLKFSITFQPEPV